jgi:hypothetical protein
MSQITYRSQWGNREFTVSNEGGKLWVGGLPCHDTAILPRDLREGDFFTQCSMLEEPFSLWRVQSVTSDEKNSPYTVVVTATNGGKLYLRPDEILFYQGGR